MAAPPTFLLFDETGWDRLKFGRNRYVLGSGCWCRNPTLPYRRFPMTAQCKGQRALTLAVRAPSLAKLLHRVQGHDPIFGPSLTVHYRIVS